MLLACAGGYFELARWLITEAGSDARSERERNVRLQAPAVPIPRCAASSSHNHTTLRHRHSSVWALVPQDQGFTALLYACESGDVEFAKWLVREAGSYVREHCSVRVSACASPCVAAVNRERLVTDSAAERIDAAAVRLCPWPSRAGAVSGSRRRQQRAIGA
jgi:hypothetical protein